HSTKRPTWIYFPLSIVGRFLFDLCWFPFWSGGLTSFRHQKKHAERTGKPPGNLSQNLVGQTSLYVPPHRIFSLDLPKILSQTFRTARAVVMPSPRSTASPG